MRFEKTTVLITGAGSGIGRAASLTFAKQGADIAAADMSLETAQATAQEIQALGRKALGLQVNVMDPASVKAMVEQAVAGLAQKGPSCRALGPA